MPEENIFTGDNFPPSSQSYFLANVWNKITVNPMSLSIFLAVGILVYKIIKQRSETTNVKNQKQALAELPELRRDLTVQELRQFDGTQPDGRVLVGVNGNVYDVTKGRHFYGPNGPYAAFAGRDASRNLATFSFAANDRIDYDDLSDLSNMEMETVRDWELKFQEKYDLVGKLLRNQSTSYEDDEVDTDGDSINTHSCC